MILPLVLVVLVLLRSLTHRSMRQLVEFANSLITLYRMPHRTKESKLRYD